MRVQAKFEVKSVTLQNYKCYRNGQQSDVPVREIVMEPICTKNTPENASFAEATPNGRLTFTLNNPDLKDEFQPGNLYLMTFDKVTE